MLILKFLFIYKGIIRGLPQKFPIEDNINREVYLCY
jgi:hypothetical protein